MWRGNRLAVVLPTYNEADSIAACIKGFESLGVVDEIVVVNNNAHPDTSANVATTTAREVPKTKQGYGAAIRRGLAETAEFDLVVICEPDGTFDPDDLWKLLPFLSDADVVFGSRTCLDLHLHRRQHGHVPPLGQLGGRQRDRTDLQHGEHVRCRLHLPQSSNGPR